MTNEEATNWLLATLQGHTGGAPLSDDEIRAVAAAEVIGTRFEASVQDNRLLVRLPTENGMAEFLVTIQRVVR